ncbi:MAG: integrase [Burkholderiaceae bacterium]|nr:integrase [Burkholderiaceae bacterium]
MRLNSKTHGQSIIAMTNGSTATLEKIDPCGSLQARKQTNGTVMFFWRYSQGTQSERIAIGAYDSSAPPKSIVRTERGYSVTAAIREAQVQAQRHFENKDNGGYSKLIEIEGSQKSHAKSVAADRKEQTLQKLLLAYCDHLEKLGRASHSDARSIFKNHVFTPWPELSLSPAADITAEQVADMMRRVHENGQERTSNKLRSYSRAAFQVAKSAKTKASIPASFKAFKIAYNPVSDTDPDTSANKADKNPLTVEEMMIYWSCIKAISGLKGAVLRLHLLTGGLRIRQLMLLKTSDIDKDTMTLFDIKGRPGGEPRPYTTPLLSLAKEALEECCPTENYAISTDGGKTHLAATTFSRWACDAVGTQIANFNAKRIRSGVETLLAKYKFSEDLRGRLQSHGMGGVQKRHYDGHTYVDEKKEMLEVLQLVLTT